MDASSSLYRPKRSELNGLIQSPLLLPYCRLKYSLQLSSPGKERDIIPLQNTIHIFSLDSINVINIIDFTEANTSLVLGNSSMEHLILLHHASPVWAVERNGQTSSRDEDPSVFWARPIPSIYPSIIRSRRPLCRGKDLILGDHALLYIPYVMHIWAPLIPATRWSCSRLPAENNNC